MNTIFTVFLVTFLVIFVLTAVISLASLPKRGLEIDDYFRKKLFSALILEVVACVVLFVSAGIKQFYSRNALVPESELREVLTKESWHWSYAPRNWHTIGNFETDPQGQLVFKATTFYARVFKDKGQYQSPVQPERIFDFKSSGPITISGNQIDFDCEETIYPSVSLMGEDAPLPGSQKMHITLHTDVGLNGDYFGGGPPPFRGGLRFVKGSD
jgi:hypothetical protein